MTVTEILLLISQVVSTFIAYHWGKGVQWRKMCDAFERDGEFTDLERVKICTRLISMVP